MAKNTPPPQEPALDTPSPFASMGEVAEGGAYAPTEDMGNRNAVPVTKVPGCAPFLLMFDPRAWIVMGGRVIPRLKRMAFIPGVGGVDQSIRPDGTRIPKPGAAKSQREDAGERVIPFDAVPPSHRVPAYHQTPGSTPSYLWRPKGRPDVNLLIYERCYPGSDRLDCDEKGYLEFIDYLLEKEHITPPPAWALRDMLEKVRTRAEKAAERAGQIPSLKSHADALARQVEIIEAELAERDSGLRPSSGGAAQPEIG